MAYLHMTQLREYFLGSNPPEFQKCFWSWIQSISCFNAGEVIAIDGKTLRHSYDRGGDKKAIHMVSAWATSQRLVLGQVKVDKKFNEITDIPALLKVLELIPLLQKYATIILKRARMIV